MLHIEWPEYVDLVDELAESFIETGFIDQFDRILAIPRGGLIPGVMLSHKLQIPLSALERPSDVQDRVIIVDDILDTGSTLIDVFRRCPTVNLRSICIAVVIEKPVGRARILKYFGNAQSRPSVIGAEQYDGSRGWVVFPYELSKTEIENEKQ